MAARYAHLKSSLEQPYPYRHFINHKSAYSISAAAIIVAPTKVEGRTILLPASLLSVLFDIEET